MALTCSTATIDATGLTLTTVWVFGIPDNVTHSTATPTVAYGSTTLTCVYASGDGTSNIVWTISEPVPAGETTTTDFPASTVTRDADASPNQAITGKATTNNSTAGKFEKKLNWRAMNAVRRNAVARAYR